MKEYWAVGEKEGSYGLGFHIYQIGGRKIVGHGGGFPGFITQISLDIENDIGVITLINANESSSLNTGIFETLYAFIDEKNGNESEKILHQEKFEGTYRSRWSDIIVVGLNTQLVAFEAKANSPMKDGTLLKAKNKKNL